MKKYISALAALGAALSFAMFVPPADAGHFGGQMGGGMGGHMGHMGGRMGGMHAFNGGHHMAGNFGRHHGDHWRGGGWYGSGWGPGIYIGDDDYYYGDDYYDYCYWRHGRRFC